MGGVDQPLLSIASQLPNNGAINGDGGPAMHSRRFLDRSGRFQQSLGQFNIQRKGGDWRRIYWDDAFHTVINTRTSRIITGIFVAYFFVILFFAMAYLDVSNRRTDCHLGLKNLMDSYIFSLETIMTIGYGAPTDDIFYGGCSSMAMLLTLESFAGIFLDSICIGVFYARFSRANARANTIMFSHHGVIRKIRGHYYLMLQVCERRKHQLVEAHVRLYAVRHEMSNDDLPESLFQVQQMRIQQPDDDNGAMLLMVLPQVIVHRIDQWSPLFPRECLPESGHFPSACPSYPDPSMRQCDVDQGNRDGLPAASNGALPYKEPTKAQIMEHLRKSELEVIVILEGIDSLTSNTMQARHSFTFEELVWDATFERCVFKTPQGMCIDFDRFHTLKPAPADTEQCVMSCQY